MARIGLAAGLGAVAVAAGGCDLPPVCAEEVAAGEGGDACVVLNHPPEEVRISLPDPQSTPLTGRAIRFSAIAFDPDEDDELFYEWDFNDDGEFDRAGYASNFQGLPHADRVEHIYRDGGLKTVTLRVSDFPTLPGGEGRVTATRQIRVYDPEEIQQNLPAVAAFSVVPNPAGVGQVVRFDASESYDPNPEQVIPRYEWDFDGDGNGDLVETDPFATWTFDVAGEYTVRLRVHNELGGDATVSHTSQPLSVLADSPPQAALTADPNPALVEQSVTFDASGSDDPDGDIAGYQFDLEGDGTFGPVTDQPTASRMYFQPGTFPASVRVIDAGGRTGVAQVSVRVEGDGGSKRRPARAAEGPGLAFSARIEGRRMRARLLDIPGVASSAERGSRRFLDASWDAHVRTAVDPATQELRVRGIALATGRGRHSPRICIRLRATAPAGAAASGRLRILGGTRGAARLRGGGRFRAAVDVGGRVEAVGRIRAGRGPARALPRRCARLD